MEETCSKCNKPPGKKKSQKSMVFRKGKYYHPNCIKGEVAPSTPSSYYANYTIAKGKRGKKYK